MPYNTLPTIPLRAQSTGTGIVTNAVNVEEARNITICMLATANAASTGAAGLQASVCLFNPMTSVPDSTTLSTGYFLLSTTVFSTGAGLVTSSGYAFTITNTGFRGLRLVNFTSATSNEVVAYVIRQVRV